MNPQAIWHPQSCIQTSLVLFRQRLTLSSTPVSAFIRLSSSSPWVLYINKKRVGSCLDINMSCKTFGNQLNITPFLADGDYDLIVKVRSRSANDWFRAECEVIGEDRKRRFFHSGTSWQYLIDRCYYFDEACQALTYKAAETDGVNMEVSAWEKACIVDAPDSQNIESIDVEEREILPTLITELGEVDAAGSIDINTIPESFTRVKFVHPESLLQVGKTEALVQTRSMDRAAYAVIDMGRVVYGDPRIRFRCKEGTIIDLGFSLNKKKFENTVRRVCKDGYTDWIIPLSVTCRFVSIRVSCCSSEMQVDSLAIIEQAYDVEVKTKIVRGSKWDSYFDVGLHALKDARRASYIDHGNGKKAFGLHAYILGLNDIYRTGNTQTLRAMLAATNNISSREEYAALALCAVEFGNHSSKNPTATSLSVITDGLFYFSSISEEVPVYTEMLIEAACEKLKRYFVELGDGEMVERLNNAAKVVRSRYMNNWSIENGIIEAKQSASHDALWADSIALYFQLVEHIQAGPVVQRVKDFHVNGENLWLACLQAGALWQLGEFEDACSVIEENWGRLLPLSGRTWSEKSNTLETLPGPDAIIACFYYGIRSITAEKCVLEIRPSVQSLERVQAEFTIRENTVGLSWALNGAGYLQLEVKQNRNSELRLAVPRLGKRFPTITINGEMVWRNEKVYNNFQVQEVISELEYVVFVVYKAGVYKVELSA